MITKRRTPGGRIIRYELLVDGKTYSAESLLELRNVLLDRRAKFDASARYIENVMMWGEPGTRLIHEGEDFITHVGEDE